MHDVRLAFRSLRSTPVVTAAALLSLALGIGANTAIFSLVDALVLRTLPVPHPEQLVALSNGDTPAERNDYSFAAFDQVRRHAGPFSGALAFSHCCGAASMSAGGGQWTVDRFFVSGDFFTTLGLTAAAGRFLTPADDVVGGGAGGPKVIISHRLWRERFGGRADAINTPVVIERVPATIVGVTPADFHGMEIGRGFDVILPERTEPLILAGTPFDDTTSWLSVMLRLEPGVAIDAAVASLRAAQPRIRAGSLPRSFQSEFLKAPFTLTPAGAGRSALRQRFARPLSVLLVVVVLVLLVACANVANVQLARGAARAHELSVRLALGASRAQLARQMFAESLVLAGAGTVGGLVFALWASRAMADQLSTATTPVVLDLSASWRVLAFTSSAMIATALLSGLAPAARAARGDPMDALREQIRGAGRALGRWTGAWIVSQVALSLVLVVGAGLFVETFAQLAKVPLGFDRDRTMVVILTAPTVPATERNLFYHRLIRTAAAVPGVLSAGGSLNPPLIGTLNGDLAISRAGEAPVRDAVLVSQGMDITPGWLQAYGLPLRAGRDFDDRDTVKSPPVMIVNEAFVRRLFPGENLIGQHVMLTYRSAQFGDIPIGVRTVVGIVGDAIYRSMRAAAAPTIYSALAQRSDPMLWTYFYITVRATAGSPALLARSLTTAFAAMNPDLTLTFRPVADQVRESLAQDRLLAQLAGFFGALALLLAAVGLYGVTAESVGRRRSEIGIRMALGASPRGIVRMVLARVAVLVGGGLAIGSIASVWLSGTIASLLYGVAPRDPATLEGAAVLLAAVAAVAAWLPARRAARIDPAEALREV